MNKTKTHKFGAKVYEFDPKELKFGTKLVMFGPKVTKFSPKVTQFAPKVTKFGSKVMEFGSNFTKFSTKVVMFRPKIRAYNATSQAFGSNVSPHWLYSFDALTGTFTWIGEDNSATVLVTHTIYDSLGRVVGTQRYKDAQIGIGDDTVVGQGQLTTTAPDAAALVAANKRLNTTSTVYDSFDRVVESVNADGLRSGTIYYTNGQAHYSGVLLDNAMAD